MLKKIHRLSKSKDVKTVIARGKGFFSHFFNVKYQFVPEIFQCTVVVSTKVDKRAVVRNRIKRQIRETLRLNMSKFKPGKYAVMVKPAASGLISKHLIAEFIKLTSGAKLLNPI